MAQSLSDRFNVNIAHIIIMSIFIEILRYSTLEENVGNILMFWVNTETVQSNVRHVMVPTALSCLVFPDMIFESVSCV